MDKSSMGKKTEDGTPDLTAIFEAIRKSSNKDSNAYKVTEYHTALITGDLDAGGVALVRAKILNIEKYLREWVKDHPNDGATIIQLEESALVLINDLRDKGFLE